MRSIALALAAILLLPIVGVAGQTEVDHIGDISTRASAAWKEGDMVAYEAAKADFYAVATDPQAPPACREFAEVSLVAYEIVDIGERWADLQTQPVLFDWAVKTILVARNNCLLAI